MTQRVGVPDGASQPERIAEGIAPQSHRDCRQRSHVPAIDALDVDRGRREWQTARSTQQSLSGIRRLIVADCTMLLGYDHSCTELYLIRGLR